MASQYRRRSLMLNTIAKVAQGNPTIITDSSSRRLQKLNVYGQSEQASTTGAQLLDPSLFESNDIVKDGIHFIKNSDGSITINGMSTGFSTYNLGLNRLEDGTYFINGTKDKVHVYVNIKKADSESFIENNSFSIDGTETSISIYIQVDSGYINYAIIYPMLNLGNTAKSFEPYTDGKSSPSPDYPQDILSKEVNEIKVTGANMLKLESIEEATKDGITYLIKDGLIKVKGTAERNGDIAFHVNQNKIALLAGQTYIFNPNPIKGTETLNMYLDFSNMNTLGFSIMSNNLNKPITLNELQAKYTYELHFVYKTGQTVDMEYKPQVLMSNVLLPYEPYKEQVINLTSPITLRGIPVDNGGNITIDGKQYIADYIDSLTGKVNRLNGYIDSYNGEEVGTIFMSTTGQLTTGAKVIYKLSQPTQEDLPQQDQEAIRALTTYYPNTVIQTGCWNEVTYSAKRGG